MEPVGSVPCFGPGPAGGLPCAVLAVTHRVEEVRIDRSRGDTRSEKAQNCVSWIQPIPNRAGHAQPRVSMPASPRCSSATAHRRRPRFPALRTHQSTPVAAVLRLRRGLASVASTRESYRRSTFPNSLPAATHSQHRSSRLSLRSLELRLFQHPASGHAARGSGESGRRVDQQS